MNNYRTLAIMGDWPNKRPHSLFVNLRKEEKKAEKLSLDEIVFTWFNWNSFTFEICKYVFVLLEKDEFMIFR